MRTRPTQRFANRERALTALGLGLAAVAAMLIPAPLLARDEAAAHARLHVASAAVGASDVAALATCRLAGPAGAGYESVGWSPDGQSLAYQAGGNVYTLHVGSIAHGCGGLGAPRLLVRGGTSPSWGPR
jgi:hypothetical protein